MTTKLHAEGSKASHAGSYQLAVTGDSLPMREYAAREHGVPAVRAEGEGRTWTVGENATTPVREIAQEVPFREDS